MTGTIDLHGFDMAPATLEREWVITIDTPTGGVAQVLAALEAEIPMVQGPYDCCTLVRDNGYQRQSAVTDEKPVIEEVKEELQNLRELMKTQLNVLEWDRYNQRHPVRSVLLNLMAELGLGSDVTEKRIIEFQRIQQALFPAILELAKDEPFIADNPSLLRAEQTDLKCSQFRSKFIKSDHFRDFFP